MRASECFRLLTLANAVVEWDASTLPWAEFRGELLGPTDPSAAPADSIRGTIMSDWVKLGLTAEPNTGNNGVHASASPFEGMAERMNWLQVPASEDPFAKALLEAGLSEETIKAWSVDPRVKVDGEMSSIFDALEDMDAGPCLDKLKAISAEN